MAEKFIQKAIKHPGAFTAKAKKAGKSVAGYARQVLKEGSQATTQTKRQAALAKTLRNLPKRGSGELTELGSLTLARFQERFGKEAGHKKFEQAVDDGHISRPKMFRQHEGKFRQQQR